MNQRELATTLGLSLIVPAFVGLFSAGAPTLYCPMPTMTVVAAFALSLLNLQAVAVLVPTIFFFLWPPRLITREQSNMPKRTVFLERVS